MIYTFPVCWKLVNGLPLDVRGRKYSGVFHAGNCCENDVVCGKCMEMVSMLPAVVGNHSPIQVTSLIAFPLGGIHYQELQPLLVIIQELLLPFTTHNDLLIGCYHNYGWITHKLPSITHNCLPKFVECHTRDPLIGRRSFSAFDLDRSGEAHRAWIAPRPWRRLA